MTDWLNLSPLWGIVLAVVGLLLLGLVVLASASQSFNQDGLGYFHKQLILLVPSLCLCFLASKLNWEALRSKSSYIGIGIGVLLVLVLVPGLGIRVNGAQRWLNLGFVRLQVSEFAKIALVFVLADYLSARQRSIQQLQEGFLYPMLMVGLCSGLIILEPDFGTAFLCGLVGFLLMFLAGTRLLYLIPCVLSGLLLFSIAVWLNPVRLKRITSFLDIEGNKSEGAYQLWQGILAFGAGGINGVGLGNGKQQIAFLPEAHTDFIFPIIGEELGLVFTLCVVGLFFILFVLGMKELKKAPDLYSFLLAGGSLLFIVLQSLINIGVVTGILPTKGMCLPFISYGGASLMSMLIFVGILIHCLKKWNAPIKIKARDL